MDVSFPSEPKRLAAEWNETANGGRPGCTSLRVWPRAAIRQVRRLRTARIAWSGPFTPCRLPGWWAKAAPKQLGAVGSSGKRSVCHVVRLTDTLEHHSIRPGTPLPPNTRGTRYSYLGNVTAARPCKACAGVPGLQCRQCGNTGNPQRGRVGVSAERFRLPEGDFALPAKIVPVFRLTRLNDRSDSSI